MALHAFVAMPFGTKEKIDFNRVYLDYIKPALEGADFEVFRADEEMRAGNIRIDMLQELLLADLVVVDLSIDNPNVWYELGIRHALRARGVIQIQCKRDYMPFDVCVDRTLEYHVKDGVPDPENLKVDKKALADYARNTMESWHGKKTSPVYHLLQNLKEPDWKSLRTDKAKEFWEAHKIWANRIEIARKGNRPGDILVLADEAPTRVLRLEAHRTAGKALLSLGKFALALEEYEKALTIEPTDLESRQKKGLLLGRLKRFDQAKQWLQNLCDDRPNEPENLALLGRVEKDAWIDTWRQSGKTLEGMRETAKDEEALLEESIKPYAKGFRLDPSHIYSGINAVTLMHLYEHLGHEHHSRKERVWMEGGLRWAIQSALVKTSKDYWTRVTLGDLEVLVGNTAAIERAYKEAVAVAEKNWFALDSSRQQLQLLKDLGFRPDEVGAALTIFDRALEKLTPPEKRWEPRRVFLFSGHMIDAPDRKEPRFPASKESIAAVAIAKKLDQLAAGPDDLALCGGACGGDILFAEACLHRGMSLEVRIPFAEPTFLQKSVTFAGEMWRDRFFKMKEHPKTRPLMMPEELGPLPQGVDPYSRDNLWQLYTALSWGPEKVKFICLWNKQAGDGPGGTKHMHDTVQKHSGQAYIIDTTTL